MQNFDVIIVGGGMSGIVSSIFADKNKSVLIIEKGEKLGQKILQTGNGKCNLTNIYATQNCAKSYNENILDFLNKFSESDTIAFFQKLGLEMYVDNCGRVYPTSNSANSVLDVLRLKLATCTNVQTLCNVGVIDIKQNGTDFEVLLNDGKKFSSQKLILAVGGNSNLPLILSLGLNVKPYQKSLCSLVCDGTRDLSGIRVDCIVKSSSFCEEGEVLFKDNGLSGIVIFNLSAMLARKNNYGAEISLDLLPTYSTQKLLKTLKRLRGDIGEYKVENLLVGVLHKTIARNVLKRSGLNLFNRIADLTDTALSNLVQIIKNFTFKSYSAGSNNQVFSGGVGIKSLNGNLSSLKNTNLFVVGECVDVDGICGGYNLQWAITSGAIAGKSV